MRGFTSEDEMRSFDHADFLVCGGISKDTDECHVVIDHPETSGRHQREFASLDYVDFNHLDRTIDDVTYNGDGRVSFDLKDHSVCVLNEETGRAKCGRNEDELKRLLR
jgi:hypothetical protein